MDTLERGDEDELVKELRKQLREKYDERSARLEVASTNDQNLRSQINRVKETVNRIFNEDKTLGERINDLFREQGIMIHVHVVSILTVISLAISTIVASIVASVAR